jgi:argininosuccinate lyase
MKARSTRSRQQSANDEFLGFTGSIDFDQRLWRHDIAGSIAHAHTLASAGVLTNSECRTVVGSLKEIARSISEGKVVFDRSLEDIHMNVEKLLVDRIGETGKKLHTGRSRNDQVALDMRLFVRDRLLRIASETIELQNQLIHKGGKHPSAIMPGYTHMQHAQPVLLSHHMMAYFWKLQRDIQRLEDCYKRANISPLGTGALAGTSYKLDRSITSKMLGMEGITENSIDAVSDRDFVAESVFALSLIMIHLSSLSEELVLWSSQEFGFIKLPKELSSGSSMMPQKRNPDLPELVRGKSGRTVGDLVAILTLLKSLPLAYNRDLQEDKEILFDAFDTVEESLHSLTSFLQAAKVDRVRMRKAAEAGLMTATDLADFLTQHGVPFRTAHGLVEKIAQESDGDERKFMHLADDMIRRNLKDYKTSDLSFLSIEKSVGRRTIEGGTSSSAVKIQMDKAAAALVKNIGSVNEKRKQIHMAEKLLG